MKQKKLTEKQVEKIIKLRINGLTFKQISFQFPEIHPNYVRDICVGKSWGYIHQLYKEELQIQEGKIFISIISREASFTFSRAAAKQMNLRVNDCVIFKLNHDYFLVEKNSKGFQLRMGANGTFKFNRASLLDKLLAKFALDSNTPYRITGTVTNEIFKSMEIIDQSNAPRKSGNTSKESFLMVNKHSGTVRFSAKAVEKMQIEGGDKIIIGREKGELYISLSDSDQAFNIRSIKYRSSICTSSRFGMTILQHFKLDNNISHKIFIDETPVKKNGLMFFKLLRNEK